MLDPRVAMSVVALPAKASEAPEGASWIEQDVERARQLRRELEIQILPAESAQELVQLAQRGQYDVMIIAAGPNRRRLKKRLSTSITLLTMPHAGLSGLPHPIPQEVDASEPSKPDKPCV